MHTCKGYISGSYRGGKTTKNHRLLHHPENWHPWKKSKGLQQHHTKVAAAVQPRSVESSKGIFPEQVTIPQRFSCANGSRVLGERGFPQHLFFLSYFFDSKQNKNHIHPSQSHIHFSLSFTLSAIWSRFFFWLQAHNVLDLWPVDSLCGLRWKFLRSSKWNWFGVWQGEATIAMQQQVLLFNPMNAIKLENIFLFHTIHITCIF